MENLPPRYPIPKSTTALSESREGEVENSTMRNQDQVIITSEEDDDENGNHNDENDKDENYSEIDIFPKEKDRESDYLRFQEVNDSSLVSKEFYDSTVPHLPFSCFECKCKDERKESRQHNVSRT